MIAPAFEGNNDGGTVRVTGIGACDTESTTCPDVLLAFAGGNVSWVVVLGPRGMEIPDKTAGDLAFSIDLDRNHGCQFAG